MVTRLAAFTLCCAFVVAAAIPHADAQSDSAGVDTSGGTAAPDARVALLFTPAASEHRALEDRWRQLRQAPAGTPDEEQAFLAFERTALELGYVDLPAHGLALLLEAETARRTGDVGRASILRHRAAQIAPTSPQPAFFRARLAADEGPASVLAMSRHLTRAYQRLGQTVAGHLALQTFARELLGLVFLVFAALFGLLLAGRALGPAALDLRLLSAKTLTLGHGRMLVVLVLVAPAAMLWSPLLALLGPFVVAAPYAKVGERAMSLMVLAGSRRCRGSQQTWRTASRHRRHTRRRRCRRWWGRATRRARPILLLPPRAETRSRDSRKHGLRIGGARRRG